MAIDFSFLQAATASGSDLTTYTFAGQATGTADAGRTIICAVHAMMATQDSTYGLVSVTINGVAAVIEHFYALSSTSLPTTLVGIATATVPTGTTGDVVVTLSEASVRCQVALWRATGLSSNIPWAVEGGNANGHDPKIATPGGIVIAIATNNGATTTTWPEMTEDYDDTVETMTFSAASGSFINPQDVVDVTPVFASDSISSMVAASWSPDTYSRPAKPKAFYVSEHLTNQTNWAGDARMQVIEQVNAVNIIGTSDTSPSTWDEIVLPRAAGAIMRGRWCFTDLETWVDLKGVDDAERARRYTETLTNFKNGFGSNIFGEYEVLPNRDIFSAIDDPQDSPAYKTWQALNDNYLPVGQVYKMVFPSVYQIAGKSMHFWRVYAQENIREARRLAPNATIIAFITPFFKSGANSGETIPGSYWRGMLEELYEIADGVIVWGASETFTATEGWWVETDLWLDELTNRIQVTSLPGVVEPKSWDSPQNMLANADWKTREVTKLPLYWSDSGVTEVFGDNVTFTDNGDYDTVNMTNTNASGRVVARKGVFPTVVGEDYTLLAYISAFTFTSGANFGGARVIDPNRNIVVSTTNFTAPGWYCVGFTATSTSSNCDFGLGLGAGMAGTLSIDRMGVYLGFIGPVTSDNDRHGPLTTREMFAVPTISSGGDTMSRPRAEKVRPGQPSSQAKASLIKSVRKSLGRR